MFRRFRQKFRKYRKRYNREYFFDNFTIPGYGFAHALEHSRFIPYGSSRRYKNWFNRSRGSLVNKFVGGMGSGIYGGLSQYGSNYGRLRASEPFELRRQQRFNDYFEQKRAYDLERNRYFEEKEAERRKYFDFRRSENRKYWDMIYGHEPVTYWDYRQNMPPPEIDYSQRHRESSVDWSDNVLANFRRKGNKWR